jgi:hypothetical protein
MKPKKIELDVDFIGGQEPLTKEEEKNLSDYFAKRKKITSSKAIRKTTPRKKVTH